ncbi:unnamed protein product, partial [Adineta steineri]
MWSTFVWSFVYITVVSSLFLSKYKSLAADTRLGLPPSNPDIEYEQVIAKRYLFAPFANESTAWPVLTNIHNVYQVVSLPQYYAQAAEGF